LGKFVGRIVNGNVLFWLAVGANLVSADVSAQTVADFPSRAVRMVVPFAPGGTGDVIARLLGARLTQISGAQYVVDNRGGGGGLLGTDIVAKAQGDGYTQLLHSAGIAYEPALREKLPYDTVRDLAAVTFIGFTPNLMVAHPTFAPRTAQALIAQAKQKPGEMTYGSGGVGSSSHLAVALFQSLAGIQLNHVPYKGAGPALGDVVAGQIGFMIATMPGALPHVKSTRLRALGVSSLTRAQALPDTPTIAESGLPGYDYVAWFGVFAPGITPRALINRIDVLSKRALADGDLKSKLELAGVTLQTSTPVQFQDLLKTEIARWKPIIAAAGIKASM
jgi:tripartite-type tricarboxylate transporter receptor subunit TctC